MKRKGYEDMKNTHGTGENQASFPEEDVLERKIAEKKKRLKVNILEFFVWLILWWFCWSYLQTHPAEKTALLTGIKVITQKVNIWFSAEGDVLKQKYDLERNFEEVISLGKWSSCLAPLDLVDLRRKYKMLQSLSAEEFMKEKGSYMGTVWSMYRKIQSACKKK